MKSLLEIANVKQGFRSGFWMKETEILHGISFQVPKGAIFGFLGPNGAGKTTLIQLIVGLRKPSSGTVRIFEKNADTQEARMKMGYLPERPYFYEHLTGERFLKFFGTLSGMPKDLIEKKIPEVLNTVGMAHGKNLELKRYSKGMLQRIGIAQAILHDPELLVFDEPMSGLDPIGRKEIRELILKLSQLGKTIFFSTHIIPDVEAICDQVAIIKKGNLIGCGKIGEFLSQGEIQTEVAYSGPKLEILEGLKGLVVKKEMPDGVRVIVDGQASAQEVVQKVFQNNGTLLWVTPIRPSLERFFNE